MNILLICTLVWIAWVSGFICGMIAWKSEMRREYRDCDEGRNGEKS